MLPQDNSRIVKLDRMGTKPNRWFHYDVYATSSTTGHTVTIEVLLLCISKWVQDVVFAWFNWLAQEIAVHPPRVKVLLKFPGWFLLNSQRLYLVLLMSLWGLWLMIGQQQQQQPSLQIRSHGCTNYGGGGPTGTMTIKGSWIIFMILLKSGWKVSTCARRHLWNHFLIRPPIQRAKCSIHAYHWMRLIRFGKKIFATSDTESVQMKTVHVLQGPVSD